MFEDLWDHFTVHAAQSKRDRENPDSLPSQEPMKAGYGTPRAPSTDQKRVRREMNRKATSVANIEADLLGKMHRAASAQEQRALASELEAYRAGKSDAFRRQAEVDFGGQIVATTRETHPLSSMGGNFTTMDTDWMMEESSPKMASRDIENSMRAQANVWYGNRPQGVREDGHELSIQAHGMAVQAASQFGDNWEMAQSAFIEQVRHLASRTAAGSDWQQAPNGSSLPAGVDNDKVANPSVFPETGKDQSSTDSNFSSPSLEEGGPVDSAHKEDATSNPVNDSTHSEGGGNSSYTDPLNGNTTAYPSASDKNKTLGSLHTVALSGAWNPDSGIVSVYDNSQGMDSMPVWEGDAESYSGVDAALSSAGFHRPSGPMGGSSFDGGYTFDIYPSTPGASSGANVFVPNYASRRTAEEDQKSTDSNFDSPTLNEGGPVEGDHSESVVEPQQSTTYDAGLGSTSFTDNINGNVTTPDGKTSALKAIATSIYHDESASGGISEGVMPYLKALASLENGAFAGVPVQDVIGLLLDESSSFRGRHSSLHVQALKQILAGDVPEAFKKQWDKNSDNKDSDSKSDSGDSDSDSDSDSKDKDSGTPPKGEVPPQFKNQDSGNSNSSDSDQPSKKADEDTKGDTTGNGKPDWLDAKMKDKSSSRTAETSPGMQDKQDSFMKGWGNAQSDYPNKNHPGNGAGTEGYETKGYNSGWSDAKDSSGDKKESSSLQTQASIQALAQRMQAGLSQS